MKRNTLLIALTVLTTGTAWAEDLPKDSLKVVDVEEVVVIASPKENRKLRELPTASTLLSQKEMQANRVTSIKSLTSLVPNLFIPDYGSKLTSAIYIRGIGSRINTPSVGLYVDNIPYIDKSAFDFNYADIERIDVLRGPQGTLYGRNTMGGLIKVHTKSPFTYQGTDLRLSAGTYGNYNASVTHYHRTSNKFAFSTGGFYEYANGFFKNSAKDNQRVDRTRAGGGRFRGIYLPSDNLKLDMTLSYEYSDQGGYPYFYMGQVKETGDEDPRAEHIGKISYNKESGYNRGLLNAGVNIEYQAKNFILSAVTGYQNLNDRMYLDQDFTEQAIFNMEQKQKLNTLSEEITLKSKPGRRWQWATGIFGFYQGLKTDGPVTFQEDGMQMLGQMISGQMPAIPSIPMGPGMSMNIIPSAKVTSATLPISGTFDTPIVNGALFHQSTFRDLFGAKGLSLTAGLRLDYERMSMNYNSGCVMDYTFAMTGQMKRGETIIKEVPMVPQEALAVKAAYEGELNKEYLQLLPKFALQYDFKNRGNIYASVSKGYRSGGYNIQMFSDLLQASLGNEMMKQVKEVILEKCPPQYSDMIGEHLNKMPIKEGSDVNAAVTYKPEQTWSYELGTHLNFFNNRLRADASLFYMDTRNQQISQFAESGLGRVTVNAGKSQSYGAELSFIAVITEAFSLNTCYGYTNATFTDYITNDSKGNQVSYKDNYVPFVPKHTLNVGAQYVFQMTPCHWLDRVQVNANYSGAGRIYWTEKNNASQSFYATLNGRVSLEKGNGSIAFWIRNALDKEYEAFYFESMGNKFMQKGRPMQLGVDLRCRF